MICHHEWDENYGLMPAARLLARCKKCHELYECEDNGKPHIIELLGKDFIRYQFGGRDIIKEKKE